MQQSVLSSEFFSCDVRPRGTRVVVAPVGEFDLGVAADVAALVEDLLDVGHVDVVIDLRDLSFLDSAGVHVLVAASRSAGRRGASLVLVRGPETVHRVFALTGTEPLLSFEDDGRGP